VAEAARKRIVVNTRHHPGSRTTDDDPARRWDADVDVRWRPGLLFDESAVVPAGLSLSP
jgi:hypothetical protein